MDKSNISMLDMLKAASEAADLLSILSNKNRLLLLCQLTQGEMCVSDLEATLDIRQPTMSQQLGILRRNGIVTTERRGKNIYYQICDDNAQKILALLYQMYCSSCD